MNAATFQRHIASDLPSWCREIDADCPLDRWVSYAVKVLRENCVETYESCQGGAGHSFVEPTVRFFGPPSAGFHALSVCGTYGLPARALRRFWTVSDGEPVGPHWEITFDRPRLMRLQREAERAGLIC